MAGPTSTVLYKLRIITKYDIMDGRNDIHTPGRNPQNMAIQ